MLKQGLILTNYDLNRPLPKRKKIRLMKDELGGKLWKIC